MKIINKKKEEAKIIVREYEPKDLPALLAIWNHVVEEANAFPQMEPLGMEEGAAFFASQTFTGVAEGDGEPVGLYILHPNHVGRCGHIANASYAVAKTRRGGHIGEKLVRHSMEMGKNRGFSILQFNAVVRSNVGAIHLYEKLGFRRAGAIPSGYRLRDGSYEDIYIYYIPLSG